MSMSYGYGSSLPNQTNPAMGQALSSACEPAPPSLFSDMQYRLETLTMLVNDASGDLVVLNDRLFGTVPRSVPAGKGQATAKPSGQVEALLDSLDLLVERLTSVRDEARSLNSRI